MSDAYLLYQYIDIALPWVLAVLVPALGIIALVVGRRTASWWLAGYFALLFFFPNTSWGIVDAEIGSNFYTRGTGRLYFSAINILLWGLVLQAFIARRLALPLPVRHNLKPIVIGFLAILAGNLVVGFALDNVRWFRVIGYSGLLNVANLMFAFYVLTAALRDPSDVRRFVNLLLACAVIRGVWAAVRFVALGGDPANFYANFQNVDVRITFFDINDSLIACLALFLAAWRLFEEKPAEFGRRLFYGFVIALELFVIVFSYRRTAWAGLVLVALFFAFTRPLKQRAPLLAAYVLVGVPALVYKLVQRAGDATLGGTLLERIVPDLMKGGQLSFTSGRFTELYAAWLSIQDSPLWGLGAWGRYDGFRFSELTWHRGDFSWMHSGVMHLMLKTGLIGVALALAMFVLWAMFVRRSRQGLGASDRGALYLGVAGVLFIAPTLALGTPVIEFRTMQMLALCLALPYLAVAAVRARPPQDAARAAAAAPAMRMPFGIRPLGPAGAAMAGFRRG